MRVSRSLLHIAWIAALFTSCLNAGDWITAVVDGVSGGKYSSLRFDKFGNAHVAHFDGPNGTINYSFWDHSLNKWFSTNVDRGSGFCSLILDSKQRPHISYPEGSNRIKHAYWDGSTWQKQSIDIHATVINYYTSIVLDNQDNPSISFYEEIGVGDKRGRLRIVTWNGNAWGLRTVDSDLGAGKFNSAAMDSKGDPAIAYADVEYQNASVRFARWNGRAWDVEILEGAGKPGTNMWSVSMLLDKHDVPHVVYTDVRNGLVKYATKKDGKWTMLAVAPVSPAYPDRNSIALDEDGKPYISYFDNDTGVLKVVTPVGDGKWLSTVVDQSSAGMTSSMQVHDGWIWITYFSGDTNQLKVARSKIERAAQASGASSNLKVGRQ